MSETIKASVRRAVLHLLAPLARLLLEVGIGVGELHQLTKIAYVRAARDMTKGAKPNFSQIAVLTGIRRADAAAILSESDTQMADPERGMQRAERVLKGWWSDPDFCDDSGVPLILPLRGPRRSFAALVKRYAGDPRSMTLLNELLRVKAVRQFPDRQVEVLSRTFATTRWDSEGIALVGEQIHDLLDTLVYNLKHPASPRYARFVTLSELNPKFVPVIVRDLTQQAELLADNFEDAGGDADKLLLPGREAQKAARLSVGIFIAESEVVIDPRSAPHAKASARNRRNTD